MRREKERLQEKEAGGAGFYTTAAKWKKPLTIDDQEVFLQNEKEKNYEKEKNHEKDMTETAKILNSLWLTPPRINTRCFSFFFVFFFSFFFFFLTLYSVVHNLEYRKY